MPGPETFAASGTGTFNDSLGIAASRSNPYTISAADITNDATVPIVVLFVDNQGNPVKFPDGNYTVVTSVEVLHAVNEPFWIGAVAQVKKQFDGSAAGQGKSFGVSVVVELNDEASPDGAQAGDVIVVHVIAIHD